MLASGHAFLAFLNRNLIKVWASFQIDLKIVYKQNTSSLSLLRSVTQWPKKLVIVFSSYRVLVFTFKYLFCSLHHCNRIIKCAQGH